MSDHVIEAEELSKWYPKRSAQAFALRSATFQIQRGEFVAIMGPSGSGKSTLLYILGGLIRPTGGTYRLEGLDITQMGERTLAQVRSRHIGFVFQSFQLLPGINALRNVELPALYAKKTRRERRQRAIALLERVGLKERLDYRPPELSGGEGQRVAVARALMNDPNVILADEPTGNLDSVNGKALMDLLTELNREGRTIMMVTHDGEIARHYAGRMLHIRDGVLVER